MKKLHRYYLSYYAFLIMLSGCVMLDKKPPTLPDKDFNIHVINGITYLENYDKGIAEDLEKSRASFSIALDIDTSSPIPYDGLACVAIRKGNLNLAKLLLDKAIILEPNYSRAYVNLAYIELMQNRPKESELLLNKSLEIYKFDPYALNNLASLIHNRTINSSNKNHATELFYKAKQLYSGRLGVIDKNLKIVQSNN